MTLVLLAAAVIRESRITEWRPVEISVYSARYHGRKTASGERYDHYEGYTAATTWGPPGARSNWALPKGSVWEVRYRGRTITVRVNDCGSAQAAQGGRLARPQRRGLEGPHGLQPEPLRSRDEEG